jgi:antitoxin (DNA-binding transcriptional repressor) of toxin-antitoxin stability system
MTEPLFPPVPEIAIESLRRSLGASLEAVRRSGEQRLVVRRGQPIAGIVTVTEARALWTLDHESAVYAEWRAMQRLDAQTRRRAAVTRQAEAERRAAFEKAVLGR